jgi:hypothetical protein
MSLRNGHVLLLVFFLFQEMEKSYAQERKSHPAFGSSHQDDTDSIAQKDLGNVVRDLFHSGPSKKVVVSRKPIFSVVPALGYTLTSRLAFTISGNCVFRFSPEAKISTIIASAAFTQNRQFTMPIESSIWTNNNLNFVGDFRLYKYPQITYGLGSNSWIKNQDPMDYAYLRLYEILLVPMYANLYVGGGYILDYRWDITHKGLSDESPSDYDKYGPTSSSISTGPTLNVSYGGRDNSINPSRGYYASLQYRASLQALGSTTNWQSLIVDARKYYRLPARSNNVIAFWSYNWLILKGDAPYLDLPSTSWDPFSNTGRGYIQGRFRGAQMIYLETEYRFGISRNGLFGGVVFVNVESFSAQQGTNLQTPQPAWGTGLRIKLNKVSRTNISIDYGFGLQGSKGLFINIGEMF